MSLKLSMSMESTFSLGPLWVPGPKDGASRSIRVERFASPVTSSWVAPRTSAM